MLNSPSPRPPRSRLLLAVLGILSVLVPVALVAGIWLGGHPSWLPGPVRDALVDDGAAVIDEALELIEEDYIEPVDGSRLADASIEGAVSSLDDRFSAYFDPEEYAAFQRSASGEFSGIGVTVLEVEQGLRIAEVFDDSPARRAGLRDGDVIVGVDGESIEGRASEVSTARIRGEEGTTVELTVLRDGERQTKEVERATVEVPVVEAQRRTADGEPVAVVGLAGFTEGAHGELRQTIDRQLAEGAEGIVLDLRGNGGGLLNEAVLVASIFIEDGEIVRTESRSGGTRVFDAVGGAISSDIPVVVLVDEGTASASEIVAGALQDRDRAEVVGQRTFGKGVFQQVKPLSNGGALDLTVGEYFLPSGRNIGGGPNDAGGGIRPDEAGRDRPSTERDEALREALDVLGGELAGPPAARASRP